MSDVALRVGYPSTRERQAPIRLGVVPTSLLLAILIYLGSHAGFALRLPQSGIGLVWPPNAILLAALLLLPVRSWIPAVGAAFLGHVVAHTQTGVAAGAQALSFLGNASQALLGAWLLRRFSGPIPRLDDVRGVCVFLAASVVAPAAASFIPAITYVQLGWAPDFLSAYRARVFANVITMLTFAPAIFLAPAALADMRKSGPRVAELAALLLALLAVHAVSFRWAPAGRVGLPALLYLPLPVMLWAAVRFGPFGLATALTVVALQWMPDARDGVGPFANVAPVATVVSLQLFLFVVAVPLMLLAAVGEARKRSEAALQASEARNRAMLAAIPDLMFLQSADGTYLDFHARDPGALLLPPESFLGKRTGDVLPPDLAARFVRAFAEATDEEPAVVQYSLPMRGEERTYRARVVRCEGDKRLSIVQDVTALAKTDEALHHAQVELARMSRVSALGELAATIAHEVDQPLCAIVANANACLRWLDGHGAAVSDVREALADVVTDGNRASEVIRRTRGLFHNGPVERIPVDLHEIIGEILALARGRMERYGVASAATLARELPPVVGDRIQLQQVVFNLITNALDAMRDVDGPRCLTVRTSREGPDVCLAVSDTGAGFDPRSVERMFEPFFTTKPDGLGMGLALTRSIVFAHHGKLWATPNDGGGATFHVSLPAGEAHGV